jgi:hypothetical protein
MEPHQQLLPANVASRSLFRGLALFILCAGLSACGANGESSPAAPSARLVTEVVSPSLEAFAGPPAPGHAFVLTAATGNVVVSTGSEAVPTTYSTCGIEWRYQQTLRMMGTPCSPGPGSCQGQPTSNFTTAIIPPGLHTVSFASYCSPYVVYDVDFSHP